MNQHKRRPRRLGPMVESLEGRVVLSGAGSAVAHPAALIQGVGYLFLNGTAHGTTTRTMGIPDTGSTLKIKAKGSITPLGSVTITGSLHGPGFILSGPVTGSLTLTNKKGSVTLSLTGPTVPGFTPPGSGKYQFHFEKGTGTYSKELADGSVDVKLKNGAITLTFHGAPNRY